MTAADDRPHPTATPEYWDRLARNEEWFATHASRTESAESIIVHR